MNDKRLLFIGLNKVFMQRPNCTMRLINFHSFKVQVMIPKARCIFYERIENLEKKIESRADLLKRNLSTAAADASIFNTSIRKKWTFPQYQQPANGISFNSAK